MTRIALLALLACGLCACASPPTKTVTLDGFADRKVPVYTVTILKTLPDPTGQPTPQPEQAKGP